MSSGPFGPSSRRLPSRFSQQGLAWEQRRSLSRTPTSTERRSSCAWSSSGPSRSVVRKLLHDVRRPAGHAAHREKWRELVGRDAEQVVDRAGVEVDITPDVLLVLHEFLDRL